MGEVKINVQMVKFQETNYKVVVVDASIEINANCVEFSTCMVA